MEIHLYHENSVIGQKIDFLKFNLARGFISLFDTKFGESD